MLDWDFGLSNIISVLLAFNILFHLPWAKSLTVSSHDWCVYLSFSVICPTVRFVLSAKCQGHFAEVIYLNKEQ